MKQENLREMGKAQQVRGSLHFRKMRGLNHSMHKLTLEMAGLYTLPTAPCPLAPSSTQTEVLPLQSPACTPVTGLYSQGTVLGRLSIAAMKHHGETPRRNATVKRHDETPR